VAVMPHPIIERPFLYGDETLSVVVEDLLHRAIKCLNLTHSTPEEREDMREALRAAVRIEDDGYAIAKALDLDWGWEVDAALVHTLSATLMLRTAAHDEITREWVKVCGVITEFVPGDHVVLVGDVETIYTVANIDAETAVISLQLVPPLVAVGALAQSARRKRVICARYEEVRAAPRQRVTASLV